MGAAKKTDKKTQEKKADKVVEDKVGARAAGAAPRGASAAQAEPSRGLLGARRGWRGLTRACALRVGSPRADVRTQGT